MTALDSESAIVAALDAYRTAEFRMELARGDLYFELQRAHRRGMSAYRLSQLSGLSQSMVGRIVRRNARHDQADDKA